MKKAVHWRRGEVREGGGRVNPATVSGEHSGVVRGLYKTLSMNDSKHLNDRAMGRGGCICVCMCVRVALGDSLVVLPDILRGDWIYSPLNVLRVVLCTQVQLVMLFYSFLICWYSMHEETETMSEWVCGNRQWVCRDEDVKAGRESGRGRYQSRVIQSKI